MVSPPAGTFQTILIIDLGAQYTQLIARRVRELNVYSEIVSNTLTAAELKARPGVIGLILSGGPNSVYKFGSPSIDEQLLSCGIPILGICYGLQLLGKLAGAKIEPARRQEFGKTELWVDNQEDSLLFKGLNPNLICWMSHGDALATAPARRDRHRAHRRHARRRLRAPQPQALRGAVPPRGDAHAVGHRAVAQFRARRVQGARRLDDGQLRRDGGQRHPRADGALAAR